MIEFFNSIGNWFAENREGIALFFSSGQFALLLSQVLVLVKTVKSVRSNTSSTNDLNKSMNESKDTQQAISDTKTGVEHVLENQSKADESFAALDEKVATLTDKVNAVIEVQSIVYSSIKDEKVRNTVSNILMGAKYAESSAVLKLKEEVESLKSKIAEKVNDIQRNVDATAKNVSKALSSEQKTDEPMRY